MKSIIHFFKGQTRGAKAKRQVLYSIFIQGLNIIIGLLYVPLLLDYLTQEKYGIWLTLTSILGWFSFFDIGMGNGLRNKLAEAMAHKDLKLGKKLVSTTYAFLFVIFGVVLIAFHISNFFLDWNSILNTHTIDKQELFLLTSVVFTFFIIRFVVQIIAVIYLADQIPSFTKLINTSANFISFIVVLILTKITTNGNLVLIGTIISVVPVALFIVASFISFGTKYKNIRPSIKSIDFKLSKDIVTLGAKFFFLQAAFIVLFTTSNIFITQFYGPEEVTVYNIAYKYFQIPIMVFSIFMSPVWSAVTDAYAKADFVWLKNTLKYANLLAILFVFGVIVMTIISNWAYNIWIGDKVSIPLELTIAFSIYSIIRIIITPYSNFINGMGKLKITVISTIIEIVVYLVLVFLFGKIFDNSTGIVLAIVGTGVSVWYLQIIQVHKLLNRTAKGIWSR
ncbi:Membrane protein involved in the export of O-antigen and teichoic acid [Mariniphaga anaerophila]|uniref:Membrane protein involved in the export of O-antigen and teichoic acid n=1 Tax=Mariniphaga anaerophila TaxID=1484053 RepID=A0A1M5BLU8_9BACT|nr:oligosaccharide flippase family protein [Mariniphaga anaerophila]SHF43197.1 Membrane protein involved in the export of O-antigen and teichoic acid [Mariniphaga anaerophila]